MLDAPDHLVGFIAATPPQVDKRSPIVSIGDVFA